jgi:hypothetical protein
MGWIISGAVVATSVAVKLIVGAGLIVLIVHALG